MKRGAKKAQGARLKAAHVITLLVAAVALFAVFGRRGLVDVWRLARERDELRAYNEKVAAENAELMKKITLLKSDMRYIGHIARSELGMVGKDEIIYRFDEGT